MALGLSACLSKISAMRARIVADSPLIIGDPT